MLKRLSRSEATQRLVLALAGGYLAFALRTTRWTLHGEEHTLPALAGQPVIAAFWHERLPLMPMLWRVARQRGTPKRTAVLVSRHADGRLIGRLIARFDLAVVHGSTSRDGRNRGGAAGLRQMLDWLAAGNNVGITPDGPRGPRREAAPGVAALAALSGVPVLPCAAQTRWRWQLDSWDRMVLPLPFGRGALVCRPPIAVPRDGAEAALPVIATALTEAAEEADRLCG
jgi:lysophospholipid acyltransferase (LPLAT)-like uncharacterized protein